jgi:phytoene dehydrogenase-like protein
MNVTTRELSDPWLAEVFERIFLPEVPVWFVLLFLGMLADGNMAQRLDGSAGFNRALEKRFCDLGGKITYKATVDEIMVAKDSAVGVRLSNGETHPADRVVSAADGYTTIYELLKGRYANADIRTRYQDWPLFNPVVMISYGVAREFVEDPWMVIVKPSRKVTAGFIIDQWLPVRIFNYSPVFSPPGKTVIQVMMESTWQPWRDLRDNIEAYKSEKNLLANQVLERLAKVWPDLDKQAEVTDVSTPYTFWRYTLNRQGAYEGFAVTPQAIRTKIYRTLPRLSNFYMAGQWTSPGGGVVPSLMTGKHAVMLLCKQDSKSFRTTTI